MDDELKAALNRLAGIYYAAHGNIYREGFDFSSSSHPQERMMWTLAVKAYEFFLEEGLP